MVKITENAVEIDDWGGYHFFSETSIACTNSAATLHHVHSGSHPGFHLNKHQNFGGKYTKTLQVCKNNILKGGGWKGVPQHNPPEIRV